MGKIDMIEYVLRRIHVVVLMWFEIGSDCLDFGFLGRVSEFL